jgi:hypothetical protein
MISDIRPLKHKRIANMTMHDCLPQSDQHRRAALKRRDEDPPPYAAVLECSAVNGITLEP